MPILNGEHIGEMIFSVFLGMILPFLITGTIFMIIRLFFRKALWNMPVIQLLVDFVLALIFLLVCAVVVWPLVSRWLKTAEIPDSPVFVNEDGTPYEYGTSTEWFDMGSHIEFHDPFEWFDMASGIEFHDPFDPESWTDIVSGAESDASTRSGDYDASLTE